MRVLKGRYKGWGMFMRGSSSPEVETRVGNVHDGIKTVLKGRVEQGCH